MNETLHEPTGRDDAREMARAALDRAAHTTLDNSRDRRVHGWATIGFGTLVAVFTGLNHVAGGESFQSDLPVTAIYVLLLFGVAAVQTRMARTWPAGTKRLSSIGVGSSVILSFVGNMALNWKSQSGPVPTSWILALVLLAVLPSVVAGVRIMRGQR